MPAVVGDIVAMGLNVAQAIQAKKDKEVAQKAASSAANTIKGIKETNPFAAVQVPTLGFNLAQQNIDRGVKSALQATKGAGAEGVIGAVPGIVQAGNEAALNLASQANETAYNRDLYSAQNQAAINQRKADREQVTAESELIGAQTAAQNAQQNKVNAITGAVEGGIGLAGNLYALSPLYKKSKEKPAPGSENDPWKFFYTGT